MGLVGEPEVLVAGLALGDPLVQDARAVGEPPLEAVEDDPHGGAGP
jgi:hypothetical protein